MNRQFVRIARLDASGIARLRALRPYACGHPAEWRVRFRKHAVLGHALFRFLEFNQLESTMSCNPVLDNERGEEGEEEILEWLVQKQQFAVGPRTPVQMLEHVGWADRHSYSSLLLFSQRPLLHYLLHKNIRLDDPLHRAMHTITKKRDNVVDYYLPFTGWTRTLRITEATQIDVPWLEKFCAAHWGEIHSIPGLWAREFQPANIFEIHSAERRALLDALL